VGEATLLLDPDGPAANRTSTTQRWGAGLEAAVLMARADLLLLAVLLGLPSASYQIFDGLPLSSWPEFVGLAS
jgi:hypothetical protein